MVNTCRHRYKDTLFKDYFRVSTTKVGIAQLALANVTKPMFRGNMMNLNTQIFLLLGSLFQV